MKQFSQNENEPIEGRILEDNEEIPVKPPIGGRKFFFEESPLEGYIKAHTEKEMLIHEREERLRRYYETMYSYSKIFD